MARLIRAATDRNPPTLGGGGCQFSPSASVKSGMSIYPQPEAGNVKAPAQAGAFSLHEA